MDLGKSLSLHHGRLDYRGWLLQLSVICLFAGTSGLSGIGSKQTLAARAPASIGMLVLGLAFLVVPLLRWRQRVEIFERGMVWSRVQGAVQVAAEQVQDVSWLEHKTKGGSQNEVKLELTNGKRYSIVDVGEPEQLVNFLRSWAKLRAGAPALD